MEQENIYIQLLNLIPKYEKAEKEEVLRLLNLSRSLMACIEKSENKPPYELNLLDLLGVNEPFTSLLLSLILNYRRNGEYPICYSFIKTFLEPYGFNIEWIRHPKITAETDRIDVCVQEDKKYAIIIENKLKGAVFQRNQLARYIAILRNKGYSDEQIFVIIIPNHHDENFLYNLATSVFRLPKDWNGNNQERKCRGDDPCSCLCDVNQKCSMCDSCETDLKKKFSSRTLVINEGLQEWLETICLPIVSDNEKPLRSTIEQFLDFLKGIYNNRLNQKLIMEIIEFLRQNLLENNQSKEEQWNVINDKIAEQSKLQSGLRDLRQQLNRDLIENWKQTIETYIKRQHLSIDIEDSTKEGFHFFIKDIEFGCWCIDTPEPYWGCGVKTEEQKVKAEQIFKEVGKTYPKDRWIQSNTLHGDERIIEFIEAAQRLGFVNIKNINSEQ